MNDLESYEMHRIAQANFINQKVNCHFEGEQGMPAEATECNQTSTKCKNYGKQVDFNSFLFLQKQITQSS